MTIEEKNRIVFGTPFTCPVIQHVNGEAQVEEMTLKLKPIPMKKYSDLQSVEINKGFMENLIAATIGKDVDWVLNAIPADYMIALYDECEKVNKCFFDYYARMMKLAEDVKARFSAQKTAGESTLESKSKNTEDPLRTMYANKQ